MSTTSEIKLCELFTVLEDDWRKLYENAFPVNERESESKLAQLIAAGRMLYHKTTNKNGEMLCFSMVSLAPDFSFLAYLATDPNQRSGGVGSKHMKKLLELLKEQFPDSEGMLLEIDATNPRKITITDEEKKIRQRRLAFYRRLGAKKLCTGLQFLGPARKSGGSEVELDLLFFSFSNTKLDCHTKKRLVSEIYQRFYCLDLDEPIVTTVMEHFSDCTKHEADCPEEDPADGQPPAATAPETAADKAPLLDAQGTVTRAEPALDAPVPAPTIAVAQPVESAPVTPATPVGSDPQPAAPVEDVPGEPEVVESDCEILEKLGKKVDCHCQDEEPSTAEEAPPPEAPAPKRCLKRDDTGATRNSPTTEQAAATPVAAENSHSKADKSA